MRYDSPDGAALLGQARETLLEELLPQLSDDARYTAKMIARVMEIAAREIAAGTLEARHKIGESDRERDAAMVRELREGRLDGDARTHAELIERVRASLLTSNPKALG